MRSGKRQAAVTIMVKMKHETTTFCSVVGRRIVVMMYVRV
jgi:hypothetical protein